MHKYCSDFNTYTTNPPKLKSAYYCIVRMKSTKYKHVFLLEDIFFGWWFFLDYCFHIAVDPIQKENETEQREKGVRVHHSLMHPKLNTWDVQVCIMLIKFNQGHSNFATTLFAHKCTRQIANIGLPFTSNWANKHTCV